jgi:hypothetical protein
MKKKGGEDGGQGMGGQKMLNRNIDIGMGFSI